MVLSADQKCFERISSAEIVIKVTPFAFYAICSCLKDRLIYNFVYAQYNIVCVCIYIVIKRSVSVLERRSYVACFSETWRLEGRVGFVLFGARLGRNTR